MQSTAAPIGVMAKKELPEVKDEVRLTNNFPVRAFQVQRQGI